MRRTTRRSRTDARTLERGRRPPRDAAPKTTVLLADDHEVFRSGLRALLDMERDLVVVGEARDGREAVETTARLRPDVVVMDVAMPHLNGFEATRQILAIEPTTRVLVLSAYDDDEYVERFMRGGAAGYVLKRASLDDLATAVRMARAGETFVSPSIQWREHSRVRWAPDGPNAVPTATPAELTSREAEVLQSIAESRSNKQLARDLGLSVKTVEKHRQSLMTKLDIHDVAGLTRYALASGVVECCAASAV